MPLLTVELRPEAGIRWRDDALVATSEAATSALNSLLALLASPPRRPFSRVTAVLDAERAARAPAELPDLNLFLLADGDAATVARHPAVANAAEEIPIHPPPRAPVTSTDADRRAHEREARGQGVTIATLGAAADLAELAPEAELEIVPTFDRLGDAIDRAVAGLGHGDVLFVPYPLASPSARAAAVHARARGLVVVSADLDPYPTGIAARAACAQSYAVAIGLGRLGADDLLALPGLATGDLAAALDALDARLAARPARRPHVRVVFERAQILRGGDTGRAEIYFEGWIDDGAGSRRAFRIPQDGYVPGVKDGQEISIDTVVFESTRPVGEQLRVHFEAWDEDLGKSSLVDPDDLLGAYEHVYTRADDWGVGAHRDLELRTDAGGWRLSYRIETWLP